MEEDFLQNYGYGYGKLNSFISVRAYNLIMGLVVVYGLLVNIVLCWLVPDITVYINPTLFLILYFVFCIGGIVLARISDKAWVSFLGYNMVVVPVGLLVSMAIDIYGGLRSDIVLYAFLYTLIIVGIMITASIIWPNLFLSLGKFLFISLIAILIMSVIELFVGQLILVSWFAAVIFSLYIGYDFMKAQELSYTVDNAVDSAVNIYLDIINLFLRILEILGKNKDD